MIYSILDNDLYKFTMQQAVLSKYDTVKVTYKFKNRGFQKLDKSFKSIFDAEFYSNAFEFKLTSKEKEYLKSNKIFKPWYVEYLDNYRFNKDQVITGINDNGEFTLAINGCWHETILWEVPLMAFISELYLNKPNESELYNFCNKTKNKIKDFKAINAKIVEFGTRRRRSYSSQCTVIDEFCSSKYNGFLGTSNLLFAKQYNINPIGTMAHEWIMGISALESLRYANRFAMDKWTDVYDGNLAIALPDTYTTSVFLKDFDLKRAKIFDGVRQDSGNPIHFINKIVGHYHKLGIDPSTKKIIFSDNINNIEIIKKIIDVCSMSGIGCSFGIGTWLTNDFKKSPLNMVIKLDSVNGIPVCKISDNPDKIMGNSKAIQLAELTFGENYGL